MNSRAYHNHRYLFTFLFSVIIFSCKNQNEKKFQIEGTVNQEKGTIYLSSGFSDSLYLPMPSIRLQTELNNGKFFIEDTLPYPIGVRLVCDGIFSDLFYIDKGNQKIDFDIHLGNKAIPLTNSTTNIENTNKFKPFTSAIDAKIDSLISYAKSLSNKEGELQSEDLFLKRIQLESQKDSAIYNYAKSNPHSYIVLWNLVERFSIWGYKKIYLETFEILDTKVKSNHTGKLLYERLISSSQQIDIGLTFPEMMLFDTNNRIVELDASLLKDKLTFVDFWFSNCLPCIKQFPTLKKLFDQYENKGFRIIGISIDREEDKEEWLSTIKGYSLPWIQYWDKNGQKAEELSINSFPYSILIDSTGKILKTHVTLSELELMLREL